MMKASGKQYKDTFRATERAILQLIADANVRGMRCRDELLQELANTAEELSSGWNYVYFERADGRVQCALEARLELDPVENNGYAVMDAEGNKWVAYRVRVGVNWPSHGSSAMAQVQARLTLFQEVAQLANEIEATYPNTVYHMVRSAEEIRFDEQQRRRLECQEKAMKVIEANCTNLRMKKVRDIYDSSLNGIDAGEYVHTLRGGKKFKLEVYTGPTAARAELTRLS